MPAKLPLTICVIGGSGGIGGALLKRLSEQGHRTIGSYHRQAPRDGAGDTDWVKMDLTREDSIAAACSQIRDMCSHTGLDGILVCSGLLQHGTVRPEKQLAQLDSASFMRAMQVNTLGPMLVTRELLPAVKRSGPATISAISARVGSISDNALGGWHSYRCSKAALNMGFRNIAIELQRSHPQCVVSLYQPGTVDTALSRPFLPADPKRRIFSPLQAADHYLKVLASLQPEDSGHLYDWAGKRIAF